jgi:hypothetical protein
MKSILFPAALSILTLFSSLAPAKAEAIPEEFTSPTYAITELLQLLRTKTVRRDFIDPPMLVIFNYRKTDDGRWVSIYYDAVAEEWREIIHNLTTETR